MGCNAQSVDLNSLGDSLRADVKAASDKLQQQARNCDLTLPSAELIEALGELEQVDCTIVVAGEVKRAKSSFINGLIGRKVLPVDADVATCQACVVTNSEREECALHLMDGSIVPIATSDLAKYGSQTVINATGNDDTASIDYIAVNTPCKYWPERVRIIDTPGMGAVYAKHKEVTQRFVPLAGGVIFVLSSNTAITEAEISFLEDILEVTPYIFFIQTRIDLVDEAVWHEILANNMEVLRERIGERLAAPLRIWPVSNKLMLKASSKFRKAGEAGEDNAELADEAQKLLDLSCLPKTLGALKRFVMQCTTLAKGEVAVKKLNSYYSAGLGCLRERSANVAQALRSGQNNNEDLQSLKKQRASLAQYGPESVKYRSLKQEIASEMKSAVGCMRTTISSPSLGWYCNILKMIEAASSNDEFKSLQEMIPNEVASQCSDYVKAVVCKCAQKVDDISQQYLSDMNENSGCCALVYQGASTALTRRDGTFLPTDRPDFNPTKELGTVSLLNQVTDASGAMRSGLVVSTVATLLGGPVIGILSGIAFTLWSGTDAAARRQQQVVSQNRSILKQLLNDCRTNVQNALFLADYVKEEKSSVERVTDLIRNKALHSVDEAYSSNSHELEQSIRQLEDSVAGKIDKLKAESAELKGQLEAWQRNGEALKQIVDLYNKLKQCVLQ